MDDTPLAVFFNYPMHPTVLKASNRFFSADFVGYARNYLESSIGNGVRAVYFNGAQEDIIPSVLDTEEPFDACDRIGKSLATTVREIWSQIEVLEELQIALQKELYELFPQPNPFGIAFSIERYQTEMNPLVLNKTCAFVSIPGELSCWYDKQLQTSAKALGFSQLSILGLTNDAHGYIILPESWRSKMYESQLSFGGEFYGNLLEKKALMLLQTLAPQ